MEYTGGHSIEDALPDGGLNVGALYLPVRRIGPAQLWHCSSVCHERRPHVAHCRSYSMPAFPISSFVFRWLSSVLPSSISLLPSSALPARSLASRCDRHHERREGTSEKQKTPTTDTWLALWLFLVRL